MPFILYSSIVLLVFVDNSLLLSLCCTVQISKTFLYPVLYWDISEVLLLTWSLHDIVDCTDNIDAHAMKGYIVHDVRKGANVHIPYPDESDGVEGGCAFHHGRFVMSLRKASQAEPKYKLLLLYIQFSYLLCMHKPFLCNFIVY